MRGVLVALMVTMTACVDVNGGAVELSWSLRGKDGNPTDCTPGKANIAKVELDSRSCDVDAGTCNGAVTVLGSWDCGRLGGSTSFNIPPGTRQFQIRPLCPCGAETAKVVVPAPIVRDVTLGDVTELRALLIVVNNVKPDGTIVEQACEQSPPCSM